MRFTLASITHNDLSESYVRRFFSVAVRDLAAKRRGKDATDLRLFLYLPRRLATERSSAKHIDDG